MMKRILLLPFLLLAVFSVRAQFTIVGDATDLGGGCFLLTDTVPPAVGPPEYISAVWNNTTIDLNNGFDIRLFVSMTAELADSYFAADGMAFVLQNTGLGAISTMEGNTIGYAHPTVGGPCPVSGPFVGGITPSLAFELDIFNNNGDCVIDGPDQDHLAIVQDGNFNAPLAGPIKAMASQNEISGAGPGEYRCREFRISYEAVTDTIRVWYNNVLLAKRKQDIIATVFGGNPIVYWGITGATGGLSAHTVVCTEFADAGVGDSICTSATASLSASGGVSYAWSPAAGLSCTNCAAPTYTPGTVGTHGYLVTVTNFAGCRDFDSVYVEVLNTPIVDAGPAPGSICPGGSASLNGTVTGEDVFNWSPTGSLSGAGTLTPTASPMTTTNYTLTATDTVTGCSASDVVTVTVAPGDSAQITTPDPSRICLGASIGLTTSATPGIDTYVWTPAATLSSPSVANPTATPDTTTTYVMTASSSTTGCMSIDSVRIEVVDLQVPSLVDTTICLGEDYCVGPVAVTGALGTVFYNWSSGGFTLSTADTLCATVGIATQFALTITDSISGCSGNDTVQVNVSTHQITVDPATASINPGQLIQVSVTGGVSWIWTGGDFNCDTCNVTLATTNANGTVNLTVTALDTAGCPATANVVLLVEPYLLPNVFTPNGDGINDVVDLHYLGSDKQYEFTIVDRWGSTIMVTNDPYKVWNGKTTGGTDAPPGVYFIAVRIIGDEAIPEGSKNGAFQVTLMR